MRNSSNGASRFPRSMPNAVTNFSSLPTPWNQLLCARLREEVHPFNEPDRFRRLDQAYDGRNTFWSVPSPEPDLSDGFWEALRLRVEKADDVAVLAQRLAAAILEKYPDPNRLAFAAILRAGVPVADWLQKLLPGSVAAAISLFVGIGVDRVGLAEFQRLHPDRTLIFVDGWTGKGGVADELKRLGLGPLAVLIDPWGCADFTGIETDLFCPSACFTGPATLGFSRTFFTDESEPFSAYRFPESFLRRDLIEAWNARGPVTPTAPPTRLGRFSVATTLRIHSNEVCRALINAAPKELRFAESASVAMGEFSLLLELAEARRVPVVFDRRELADLRTRVACEMSEKA